MANFTTAPNNFLALQLVQEEEACRGALRPPQAAVRRLLLPSVQVGRLEPTLCHERAPGKRTL